MRRVRATLLLRVVILVACVALFILVLRLGATIGWTLATLVFVGLFWLVGIECGAVPLAVERLALRRAARRGGPQSSLWFVDLDLVRAREIEMHHEDTRDNPTIR
jgi:hypothetical protein